MLLFSGCFSVSAQEKSSLDGYGIEASLFAGKIIKYNYRFPPIPAISGGIDINILRRTNGKKEWQQRANYPQIGLGITYTHYGDNKILGQCIGIYPVLPIKLVQGKKLDWDIKLGVGVGYVTHRYERIPTWDTLNNIIGSRINNFTMMATAVRYKVDEHLSLHAGLLLTHISNGSFQSPNLGINLASGQIGVRYFPGKANPERISRELAKVKNRWLLQARMGMGFSELATPYGPRYPVYMPSLFVSKRYRERNKMFAGIDYSYYKGVEAFLRNNEIEPGKEAKNATQVIVFAGHEFVMGRFGLIIQAGVPLQRTSRENEGMYSEKLGYNFYLLKEERGPVKELTLHTYIKANKFEADIIEFGMGIGL